MMTLICRAVDCVAVLRDAAPGRSNLRGGGLREAIYKPKMLDLNRNQRAFTLIELVLVLLIMGIISGLVVVRTGTFSYWQDEGFIRKLSETITFLHHQAVADQAFYRLEFNLDESSYTVGVLREDEVYDEHLTELSLDAGNLSLELAAFLNPSVGSTQTLIPPPDFPSLAAPTFFPTGVNIENIRTVRGDLTDRQGGNAYIMFSPRGFSDFAVIHLRLSEGGEVTILVNPYTGNTNIYREHLDFDWSYGRDR